MVKRGDQCSRIFFRKVAMRRASKRVFQIINEDGHTLTTQEDVVNEFVSYYQRLLGGDRRREFIDLRYLRPWARHVLTQEESQALVQSVTREEIKDAFFDIAEDKAPGPDGYSSGFYKAAWPIIGEEMIKAILEFFTTGRLLKQIIVQRLRLVLDKLISPSQNAFVPGRSIGDNILLAQELFAGYNRQGLPMRCALKVDLRKAYDTVEWDFLSAVLQMFGFPGTFIGWVEECVTTPMFSVCINGNPHGFFKGSRGLRQGDPMSPFLFVMIMEVLQLMLLQLIDQNEGFSFHCGARSLDYSNFALQMTSSSSVKRMWLRFGYLDTGWPSSPNCPGYMPIHKRVSLFSPVQHRMFGNNYLQHYISRRVTFPSGWESIQLSFAGRIQLIKSVLMSLNVYWAMAFILPKGVIREVEKRCVPSCGKETQQWDIQRTTSRPFGLNGLLILDCGINLYGRGRERRLLGLEEDPKLRSALLPYIEFKIGDGESFSLWHDPWHSLGSLITRFPRGPGRRAYRRQKLSRYLWMEIGVGHLSRIWNALKFYTCYRIFTMAATLFYGEVAVFLQRYSFVLWMAILEKLSTMDKPWLSHLGGVCVLCGREMETHEHLFFRCNYSRQCIRILKGTVRFTWPNRAWAVDIAWASKRWNGRHIVQAAYRALLAAIVYHIWQERNKRVFQQSMRPSSTIARIVVDEMRQNN
ncbi:UNVERIFIED_CONTAM: hypothetical protein Sangu_3150300 [Sesamum angustifolium]|uniref:Reverse transcriptase domain-containing protein n=1 Tax=Sesamum angustifolium TaxID=2727405 RepID=A0AAW2JZ81_9LAMI